MAYLLIIFLIGLVRLKPNRAYFAPIIPALIAVGQGIAQYEKSRAQKKDAKNLRNSNYVPPGLTEAMGNARADASIGASSAYTRGVDRARQVTASTIRNAKSIGGSAGALMQSVADADAREKEITKDLEVNNEQFRVARRQDLNQLLQVKGGYQAQAESDKNAAKSALTGAAQQNEYNAFTNAMEGAVSAAGAFSGNKAATLATGSDLATFSPGRTNSYNKNSRGGFAFRNMNYSPQEIALLRSRGLM